MHKFNSRKLLAALLTAGLMLGPADVNRAFAEEGSASKAEHKKDDHAGSRHKHEKGDRAGSEHKGKGKADEKAGSKGKHDDRNAGSESKDKGKHDHKDHAGSKAKGDRDKPGSKSKDESPSGSDDLDRRASYALGVMFGSQLQGSDFNLHEERFLQAMRTAMAGEQPEMNRQEVMQVLQTWQQRQAERMQAKNAEQAKGNRAKSAAFLEENAKKDDVKTTDSGLQYKVMREGAGPAVRDDSTVTVHYEGRLTDGSVFDKTDQGRPITFDLSEGRLIEGWMEALSMMQKGDKWRLFVPPSLGYGDRPAGDIPPGSTLIFDLELVDVENQADDGSE